MHGGSGSDLFLFGEGDGADVVYGGSGGSWLDIVDLGADAGSGSLGQYGQDWTMELDHGSIVSQDGGSMTLSNDADGEIVLSDGSTLSFHDIEQIQW
ncbi:MAG: hypothetical protein ACR2PA_09425 [Hyphomicrobiaceae bacterium]